MIDIVSLRQKAERLKLEEEEIVRELRFVEARTNVNTFIECVFKDPKTGVFFKQAPLHLEWQKHIDEAGKRAMIISPRKMGKCLAKGSWVLMANNSWVEIENVQVGDRLLSFEKGELIESTCTAIFRPGVKSLRRIISSEASLTASLDHLFLTAKGWTKCSELRGPCGAVKFVTINKERSLRAVEWKAIDETRDAGEGETFDLETSAGNYIANGFIVHNSSQILGRALWELGRNVSLRIKIVSQSSPKADQKGELIRDLIENSSEIHKIFPNLKPDRSHWRSSSIRVQRPRSAMDPSLECAGVLSSGAGGEADLLLFDDICDERNSVTNPGWREKVIHAYENVWINCLPEYGRSVYIATPWSPGDCTNKLINAGIYKIHRKSIDEVKKLWPERWTEQGLEDRRKEIGSQNYGRNFGLVNFSPEDAEIESEDIDNCINRIIGIDAIEPFWPRYVGVDLASALNSEAAYSVIFVLAKDLDGHLYPIEAIRKRMKATHLAHALVEINRKHKPEIIMVESNGYQQTFSTWVKEFYPNEILPLRSFHTGVNKNSIEGGLPLLALDFKFGRWVVYLGASHLRPSHSKNCKCPICLWLQECREYPHGRFSDLLMASYFAREAAKTGGGKFDYRISERSRTYVARDAQMGSSAPYRISMPTPMDYARMSLDPADKTKLEVDSRW